MTSKRPVSAAVQTEPRPGSVDGGTSSSSDAAIGTVPGAPAIFDRDAPHARALRQVYRGLARDPDYLRRVEWRFLDERSMDAQEAPAP